VKIPRIDKNKAKNILSNVPEDKVFWVNDGGVLRNLKELQAALTKMSKETFKHHINKDRNDFKNWINDVIGDKNLAGSISKTKRKNAMINRIDKRIKQLNKIAKNK
jgi:hypothetical protein